MEGWNKKTLRKALKKGSEYKIILKNNSAIQGIFKGFTKGLLIIQNPFEEKTLINPADILGFIDVGIFPACIDWDKINEFIFKDDELKEVQE
jgi:hypothetical protein